MPTSFIAAFLLQKRIFYKRDLQKRPTKETREQDRQKRPAKETHQRDQ